MRSQYNKGRIPHNKGAIVVGTLATLLHLTFLIGLFFG